MLIDKNFNFKNSKLTAHKGIKFSILSIFGIIFGVFSFFLPWVYLRMDSWHYPPGTVITNYYYIFFVNKENLFWGLIGINWLLIGPLILLILGLIISLIFSFEIKGYEKLTQIGFIGGLLVIILSIIFFMYIILFNWFIIILFPHIGLIFAIISIILLFLGNKSLKGENEKLAKTVVSLYMRDELDSKNVSPSFPKHIRFSKLSILGIIFGVFSCFLPWLYWIDIRWIYPPGEITTVDYHISFVNQDIKTSYYQILFLNQSSFLMSSLILLIIGLTISLLSSFELESYGKLTRFTLVGVLLIIISIIDFSYTIFRGLIYISFFSDEKAFVHCGIWIIPHIGMYFAIFSVIFIFLGYKSLKG